MVVGSCNMPKVYHGTSALKAASKGVDIFSTYMMVAIIDIFKQKYTLCVTENSWSMSTNSSLIDRKLLKTGTLFPHPE